MSCRVVVVKWVSAESSPVFERIDPATLFPQGWSALARALGSLGGNEREIKSTPGKRSVRWGYAVNQVSHNIDVGLLTVSTKLRREMVYFTRWHGLSHTCSALRWISKPPFEPYSVYCFISATYPVVLEVWRDMSG